MRIEIEANATTETVTVRTQAWARTLTPREAARWGSGLAVDAAEAAERDANVRLTDGGEVLAYRSPAQAMNLAQSVSLAAHAAVAGRTEGRR